LAALALLGDRTECYGDFAAMCRANAIEAAAEGPKPMTTSQPPQNEIASDTDGGSSRASHEVEAAWALTHPDALAPNADQWVAVVGTEVVAHAPTLSRALKAARARGHHDPLLVPVMPPDIVFVE
jgi:hypothetical protein